MIFKNSFVEIGLSPVFNDLMSCYSKCDLSVRISITSECFRNADSWVTSDLLNRNLLFNKIYKFMYTLKCMKLGPNGHLYLDALSSSCFLPPQTSLSYIPRSWLMTSSITPVQRLNVFLNSQPRPPPIISYPYQIHFSLGSGLGTCLN